MSVHQPPDCHIPRAQAHVLHQREGTRGGNFVFIVVELFAFLLLIDDIPINYVKRLLHIQVLPDTTHQPSPLSYKRERGTFRIFPRIQREHSSMKVLLLDTFVLVIHSTCSLKNIKIHVWTIKKTLLTFILSSVNTFALMDRLILILSTILIQTWQTHISVSLTSPSMFSQNLIDLARLQSEVSCRPVLYTAAISEFN